MNDILKPEAQSVTERLAALPPEVQALFADPENGPPDNISKAGCLALARLGKNAWNAWREAFPVTGKIFEFKNFADFAGVDFRKSPVDFSGFVFGSRADFSHTLWGNGANFQGSQWGDEVNFRGSQWGDKANLQGLQWGDEADFRGSQWGDEADFRGSQWGDRANFGGSKWGAKANFQGAQWGTWAYFKGVQWGFRSDFQGAQWGIFASFEAAQWEVSANFHGAQWDSWVNFKGAQWAGLANFRSVTWGNRGNFQGASWEECRQYYLNDEDYQAAKKWAEERGLSPDSFQSISFAGAHFAGEVDFSNRKFTGQTDFGKLPADYQRTQVQRDENGRARFDEKGKLLWEDDPEPRRHVLFEKAPKFHGCELHQDTNFDGAVFPPASGSDAAARAYGTLKLAFSKQQALREEQRFFKLEMAEEAKRLPCFQWKWPLLGAWWPYGLYGFFSDYGFSLWRPLAGYLLLLIIFAYVYGGYSQGVEATTYCFSPLPDCQVQWHWLDFSLAQSMPLTGFDKLKSFETLKESIPATLLALHKILSLACFFLAGLALRNLFRLK